MPPVGSAAIITIGSELVDGLRVDTNTAEIARSLGRHGFVVREAISVGDSEETLADVLRRVTAAYALVVATGGLGPTHDDITRDATALALGLAMCADSSIVAALQPAIARHTDSRSGADILTQALVLEGAEVLLPTTGTAPGQVVGTPAGRLVLLPGPPPEMRPMLAQVLERYEATVAEPRELGVTGKAESDVQHAAQRALSAYPGIILTVLARPGDVRVLLIDDGAGESALDEAARAIAAELGDACYSVDGSALPQTLVAAAKARSLTLGTAESCTGGMVAAAITDVPGSSAVFNGGIVSYANDAKRALLGVRAETLAEYGAVSAEVASEMAEGGRARLGVDLAVATTGVAGPDGGTADKPVGLVWFALAGATGTSTVGRTFFGGDRNSIRARATATALDLLRLASLQD